MTPEQEAAERTLFREWVAQQPSGGIPGRECWLARARIAYADEIANDAAMKARIAALEAEVEVLRVDAQRYRWLKSRERHSVTLRDTGANKIVFCYITSRLDTPIDLLMADEKQAAEDFAAIRKAIEARDAARTPKEPT